MLFSVIKSIAIILGAFACALFLYECLTMRGRKANRKTILKRLREPEPFSGQSVSEPFAVRKLLRGIPFIKHLLERDELKRQKAGYRAELPKMFEIIALGMRVGLGFDQAFALYAKGFSSSLALLCCERLEVWERGLITRESGLHNLAASIGLKEFDRFVSLSLRALSYGAPLANLLDNLANDARKSYRAERQERVAKAPVKMLLPTGTLILPAMMMLVIGPIILDITERMV